MDIEGSWFKDGLPVTSPDYHTVMDQHSASLIIEESFGDDSAVFGFRLTTPFGEAETNGSLTVSETHKSIMSIDEDIISPQRLKRVLETVPARPADDGEAPRFTRYS